MRSAIVGGNGPIGAGSSSSYDSQSLYSTTSRSQPSKATSIHLIATSSDGTGDDAATIGARSVGGRSTKSTKTLAERAAASGVPVHKLAFDDFHNQVSVGGEIFLRKSGWRRLCLERIPSQLRV